MRDKMAWQSLCVSPAKSALPSQERCLSMRLGDFLWLLCTGRVGFWNIQLSPNSVWSFSNVCCFPCVVLLSESDNEFLRAETLGSLPPMPPMCPATVLDPGVWLNGWLSTSTGLCSIGSSDLGFRAFLWFDSLGWREYFVKIIAPYRAWGR